MPPPVCPRLALLLAIAALMAACRQPTDKLFAFSSDAPSRAGLVPLGDGVLVGNEAGRLLRLSPQGEPVWQVELGREVAARPAVAGDTVIVGTVGGTLVSLTLAEGTERWRLTGQPPVLTALVSDAGSAYAVAPDGAVRALGDGGTGRVVCGRVIPLLGACAADTRRSARSPGGAGRPSRPTLLLPGSGVEGRRPARRREHAGCASGHGT